MSATIRPARLDDTKQVVEHLYNHMSSKIPPEHWRRLFNYPWRPDDAPDFGCVVEDNGHLVGFLAGIYADRMIRGRKERYCNFSSAYLLAGYRGDGLGKRMFAYFCENEDLICTSLTSAPVTISILIGELGFEVLDDHRHLLRPIDGGPQHEIEFIDKASTLDAMFPGEGARMRRLHAPYGVEFVGIRSPQGDCLLAFHVKKKTHGVPYYEVLFASDHGLLMANAQALANHLLPDAGSVFAVDVRLMPGFEGASELELIPSPRLVRSRRVAHLDIDLLCNEVPLLDLKFP